MVFTLTDLCLISLRDGVENGTFPHVYLLPPRLRQSILNTILMRGTINESTSAEILGSVEFLSDLSSLDTQFGIVEDRKYLDRVAKSMLHVSPKGETIGATVTKLSLNLYRRDFVYSSLYDVSTNNTKGINLCNAIRLISRCPNLDRLSLRLDLRITSQAITKAESENDSMDNIFDPRLSRGGLLNRVEAWQPCLSIIENLNELSLTGSYPMSVPSFLTSDCPIIKFKRLTALRMVDVRVDGDSWRRFLLSIQETLESLHLENVYDSARSIDDHWILPFPILNLKSLTLKVDGNGAPCSCFFVKILKACQKLKYVRLDLARRIDDFESLTALNKINVVLDLTVLCKDDDPKIVIDYVKLVSLFVNKIKVFRLNVSKWNAQLTLLLRHVSQCRNLTELSIESPLAFYGANFFDSGPIRQECWTGKLELKPLFHLEERALKLRHLALVGEYDEKILKSIFDNCLNLDSLSVANCQQLNDEHLIKWVDRGGGRLSNLYIRNCQNVTDQGLMPILQSSGWRLRSLSLRVLLFVTDCTWRALIDHAPYIEHVDGISRQLMYLLRSKFLNGQVTFLI